MKKCFLSITLLALLLVLLSGHAFAQAYTFNISEETVNVYWNEDGSASLDYLIVFNNDPNAHAIDYVDLGLPNPSFVDSSITADVNGTKVTDISRSGFQGSGSSGVALGLGSQTIPPGGKGSVHAYVGKVNNMLNPESQAGMVSAVFAPAWFTTAHGDTNLTVIFHFPKGLGANDATYHETQPGWANQPVGSVDDQGLVTFTWNNPKAAMNHEIDFGASIPSTLVKIAPTSVPTVISVPAGASTDNSSTDAGSIVGGVILFAGLIVAGLLVLKSNSNKSQYEAPKASVEGYGIKRGLTAVEAAVVLEEPVDKILTMILFSVVKKGAAQVVSTDPLEVKVTDPLPDGLLPYEKQFLGAFQKYSKFSLKEALESVMTDLFKAVNQSMVDYNRQETVDYYRKIVQDAWTQVEAADTPEATSWKFEENMDWAMLDNQYAPRTQHIFQNKQVFLPLWWSFFDPNVHPAPASPSQTPQVSVPAFAGVGGAPGSKISMPVLPGADFAASMVRGTQNFSNKVIGDLNAFTQNVKTKAAPPPPPPPPPQPAAHPYQAESQSSFFTSTPSHPTFHPHPSGGGFHGGGGGHHCACACAGGGR
jgi:hypothetical protein